MKPYPSSFGHPPRPELLCAYVDGELDEAARQEIEAWLACHPEAAAEVEGQRRLAELWQAGAPPQIESHSLEVAFKKIEKAVLEYPTRKRRARIRIAVAVAGLAAAALLVLWPSKPRHVGVPAVERAGVEEFTFVNPEDVEIIRLRVGDHAGLVGPELPVSGPLRLATPADVRLLNLSPDGDGTIPVLARDRDPNAPALVRPFDLVPDLAPVSLR